MFSPISGIHTEVTDSEVRDIPEVGVPSFSLIPVSPSLVLGGTSLPSRDLVGASSQFVMPVSELLGTPVIDYSNIWVL